MLGIQSSRVAAAALLGASALTTVVAAAPAHAAPTCRGVAATIIGTKGADTLRGTPGRDVIVALGGDDVIRARGGNDLVCAGDGSDRIFGGEGRDRLHGGRDRMVLEFDADWPRAYGDELVGGPGADLLDAGLDPRADGNYAVRDRVNYAGARHALSLDLSGADRAGESGTASVGGVTDRIVWHPLLSVRGTAQGDRMVGAQGPDLLFGGPGSDRLEGRGGWDVLRPDGTGARDADVVLGGRGADDIVALGGADSLSGGDGDDWVTAQRAGARMLDGGAGNDQLTRNLGARLEGLAGTLTDGGAGRDSLQIWAGETSHSTEQATGLVRIDVPAATISHARDGAMVSGTARGLETWGLGGERLVWRFYGSAASEYVAAAHGPLEAWMGGGDDEIRGTAQDDSVDGGPGYDQATMWLGTDTCVGVEAAFSCER